MDNIKDQEFITNNSNVRKAYEITNALKFRMIASILHKPIAVD